MGTNWTWAQGLMISVLFPVRIRNGRNREAGKLTQEQLAHRLILRRIMVHAGFVQLPIEWWHYDALTKEEVRGHYKIVE